MSDRNGPLVSARTDANVGVRTGPRAGTGAGPGPQGLAWLGERTNPLTHTEPLAPLADLDALGAITDGAQIVGVGESTRAAHEVVTLGHRVLRYLVEERGFRTWAFHEDEQVVASLDEYIRTGTPEPRTVMEGLWVPWRTEEMLDVLTWAWDFNQGNPENPLRLVGLDPATAHVVDYRRILDHAEAIDAGAAEQIRRHLDVIVTAHEIPEHVQHARGAHPGRPFTDRAKDAYVVLAALPRNANTDRVLDAAERVVSFHADSIADGFDYDQVRARTVSALTELHGAGRKVVYWDGLAFTANARRVEPPFLFDPFRSVGSVLREQFGAEYTSLLITFTAGDLSGLHDGQIAPVPVPGSADAAFAELIPQRALLDLRGPHPADVADWLGQLDRLRIIGGIYEADADHEHYVTAPDFAEWFDAVVQVGQVTPTRVLAP